MKDENKILVTSTFGQIDHEAYFIALIEENVGLMVPHFFIKRDGSLVKLKDPETKEIRVCLEDVGPLTLKENEYVDYLGTIYKNTSNIVKIIWRGKEYWEEYSLEQTNTLDTFIKENSGIVIFERDSSIISRKPNPTLKKHNG